MAVGFFSPSDLNVTKAPTPLVAQCGLCKLHLGCKSPKMLVSGEGKKKILIIAEAPGSTEDEKNIQLAGKSGQYLEKTLAKYNIDMRKDCWLDNAIRCRPPKNKLPEKAVEYCRPNPIRTINELKPDTIILLGGAAIRSIIGWLWKEDVGEVGRWVGWKIPSQRINSWVCPTWHPSFLLREGNGQNNEVVTRMFQQHLSNAVKLEDKPWKKIPDYKKRVQVIIDTEEAANVIDKMTTEALSTDTPIAFDFETDRLKPDRTDATIVCCSMSDGRTSIAFPWHQPAIDAVARFLVSNVRKIASHLKFEMRWVLAKLGLAVKNWWHDTMVCAHTLDNRPRISSIKFQAFVRLGSELWDEAIGNRFEAPCANEKNRIYEINLLKLLLYCALDSLNEWKVAKHQRKEMGYE